MTIRVYCENQLMFEEFFENEIDAIAFASEYQDLGYKVRVG